MTTAHLLLCPIALDKIFSYTISYWICTFANKCINRYSSLNSRLVPSIHLITFLVLEVCSAITLELLKGTIKPLTTLEWGQKDAQTYTSIAKNKPFKRNKQELLQHCGFPSNLHLLKCTTLSEVVADIIQASPCKRKNSLTISNDARIKGRARTQN